MKTGIIIQARMGSTRLPGKIMLPLAGRAMLWHVVERCRHSHRADLVIVATTIAAADDAVQEFCDRHAYPVFRGPVDDVLERYYGAARKFDLGLINRVTSDCPLIDPGLIDESFDLLTTHQREGVAYASNLLHRDFPRGLDCEAFTVEALAEARQKSTTAEEREHVTVYLRAQAKTIPHQVPAAYRGNFRLVVDEPDDYKLLAHLYEHFYQPDKIIDVLGVMAYLKQHPEIAAWNAHVEQKKVAATPEQQVIKN